MEVATTNHSWHSGRHREKVETQRPALSRRRQTAGWALERDLPTAAASASRTLVLACVVRRKAGACRLPALWSPHVAVAVFGIS